MVQTLTDLTCPEKCFSLEVGVPGGAVISQLLRQPIEHDRTIFGVVPVEVSLELAPNASDGGRYELEILPPYRHGRPSPRCTVRPNRYLQLDTLQGCLASLLTNGQGLSTGRGAI